MKDLVIFDVDNTIVHGQSQQLFLGYLFREGHVSLLHYARINLWFILYKFKLVRDPFSVMRYAFLFTKGKKDSDIDLIVDNFFETLLKSKIYPESLNIIRKHQSEGREVILVSSAVDVLTKKIAAYLNVPVYLATKLEFIDGVCTGNVHGEIMYGERKLCAVREFAKSRGMSLNNSWAYADHGSDISLLSHVTNPYAVNPTKKLHEASMMNKWPILNLKI